MEETNKKEAYNFIEEVNRKEVYSFSKNIIEEIKVSIQEYKGTNVCDIRAYNKVNNIPTKKGLTIKVSQIQELIIALNKAMTICQSSNI